MLIKKASIIFSILASVYTNCNAVVAYPGPITHTNPDGTTITIRLHGDEWCHYATTDDGCLIARCSDGFYHYATVNAGVVVASDYIVSPGEPRPAAVTALNQAEMIESLIVLRKERRAQSAAATSQPQRSIANGSEEKVNTFPTIGHVKLPVILVDFSDKRFQFDNQMFEDWLSKEGYDYDSGYGASLGSIADYYKATSNGQFLPQFDLYGPVTAPEPHDYYGDGDDENMEVTADMVAELCQRLSADGTVDFSNYDNDGDGTVDIVYIVYAGGDAADTHDKTNIWAHQWNVYEGSLKEEYEAGKTIEVNGKTLMNYGCSSELVSGKYFATIGTFCHEFGHAMGLGDHYDVDYSGGVRHPGYWDIMASGSYNNHGNTPPLMSAYERNCLGWITPTTLSKAGNYTLPTISDNANYDDAYFIPTDNDNDNEYFILENRQKSGWDKYLPHHGMLIWHIDYDAKAWEDNAINTDKNHQRIDIVEAGGVNNTNETYTPYPGAGKNTSFTSSSSPAMEAWSGKYLDAPITQIAESADGVISFTFKGGADNSGIDETAADSREAVSVDGHTVTVATATTAEIFAPDGTPIPSQTSADGRAAFQLPAPGLYIVRTDGKAYKILAK